MNFLNKTKNQHYIAQVEQKQNAINPTAPRAEREIYAFTIIQREPPTLSAPRTERIEHNLSGLDLFTFEAIDRRYRHNLEEQFQRYEDRVEDHSRSLLQKLSAGSVAIEKELVEVFAAKFLNLVRNPFSISKMLNTLGDVERFKPTDPKLQSLLSKVETGSRPHEATICAEFELTPETYERWLRVLFMLLGPGDKINVFEGTVAGLFNNNYVTVQVCEYRLPDPRNVCLLSDRGVAFVQSDDDQAVMAFNISAKAFALFGFTDPGKRAPNMKGGVTDRLRGKVVIRHKIDDVADLVAFNGRTLEYAAREVFAAGPDPRLSV